MEKTEKDEWTCPHCDTITKGKFCVLCGTPRPEPQKPWVCPKCGRVSAAGFCPYCDGEEEKAPHSAPPPPKKQNEAAEKARFKVQIDKPVESQPYTEYKPKEKTPAKKGNKIIKYVLAFFLALVATVGGVYYFVTSRTPAQTAFVTTEQRYETTSADKTTSDAIKSDFEAGLGKIDLSLSPDKIFAQMGKGKEKNLQAGAKAFVYDDVNVIIADGKVAAIESNSDKFATKKGIKQGSPIEEVFNAYGKPTRKSSDGQREIYEYNLPFDKDQQARLRFVVNDEGKVEYISIARGFVNIIRTASGWKIDNITAK